MTLICYQDKNFSAGSLAMIDQANAILDEYAAQGFDLTLRQLYYQFVARGLLANRDTEYKRLGSVINDARMAGLVSWEAIVDRTRYLRTLPHWNDPAEILRAVAQQYRIEKWSEQPTYVEVWIEKDALVGVIEGICNREDVPFFSCRGYTSASEMWTASQRLVERIDAEQDVVILHLGDHDPSGIDMTRDIRDRLELFIGHTSDADRLEIRRVALTMDQIRELNPPPNPAKLTDSRCGGYIARYGRSSWELDALDPTRLAAIIRANVNGLRDHELWNERVDREENERAQLLSVSERWEEIAGGIGDGE